MKCIIFKKMHFPNSWKVGRVLCLRNVC